MAARREKTLTALGLPHSAGGETPVTGLTAESRAVAPGYLFAGLPGARAHGADFVPEALDRGARAVLTDAEGARRAGDALAGAGAVTVLVADPRQALAAAAALWSGAQPATMAAVTGTNGKTSVASFTRQIWAALGHRACNLGTTGIEGAWAAPLAHTTPDPVTLHARLAEMAAAGVSHAAMEASSHGLAQRRVDGVRLTAAAFTNLSQDHLDYHTDAAAYFRAKAGLFERVLSPEGTVVANLDDPHGRDIAAIARARGQRFLGVGREGEADLALRTQRFDTTGQELRFAWAGHARQLRLGLVGGFQAENALIAAALAIGCGEEPEAVFEVLPDLAGVRGRMQLAATRGNGAPVFVDYAHTPAALAAALAALRPHALGRLVVVVGAGGDRDRTKRAPMGAAAAAGADLVIVTDDNPRGERAEAIRAEIMAGAPEAVELGDRAEAILHGVDSLEAGDVLLVAGKGHEAGQIIGDDVYPFDDAEQASVAVAALEGRVV